MRLQKLLAASGHGSRRTIEDWIRAGRITVNGRRAELGAQGTPADDIRLDGRRLELSSPAAPVQLLLYHKPPGEVTTRSDPQRRPTVFDRLPAPAHGRWIVVGRLDVNTSGLLLFTTDGELAHRLMHPSAGIEREYLVRVRGVPSEQALTALKSGVTLEDGPARFDRLVELRPDESERSHRWFRVVLHEGRNREVRRLWEAVGCEVSRLTRTRYGPLELPRDMPVGTWRAARPAELERLRAALAPARPALASARPPRR